jgi:hypothetical protein
VALNNNHSLTRGGGKHEYRISLFCNKNHFNYLNYVLYLLQLKFIPRDIVDVMKSLRTSGPENRGMMLEVIVKVKEVIY